MNLCLCCNTWLLSVFMTLLWPWKPVWLNFIIKKHLYTIRILLFFSHMRPGIKWIWKQIIYNADLCCWPVALPTMSASISDWLYQEPFSKQKRALGYHSFEYIIRDKLDDNSAVLGLFFCSVSLMAQEVSEPTNQFQRLLLMTARPHIFLN